MTKTKLIKETFVPSPAGCGCGGAAYGLTPPLPTPPPGCGHLDGSSSEVSWMTGEANEE